MTPVLTDTAITKACDADAAQKMPWRRLTRSETTVALGKPVKLHAWQEPFDLWKAVAR
ncbi:hypothetical protein [Brachybacterium sp. SGAir0954]|uniref:hypothetical protein n=1 Tax=Brachybacterium sp. SGAir0954 TaxID=2571029 RepID=UPI00143D4529|nr:hypothetical protein [Brachybacterium sp. SGAir0954]